MSIFEQDANKAKRILKQEKIKGLWKKFFTLGLLNNDSKIEATKKILNSSLEDLNKYRRLKKEAYAIEQEEESIKIQGVRVSNYTFADLKVSGREDYPFEWESLRKTILERDNYSCQEENGYCNGPLQIHHIIELSKGGSNNPNNLISLCKYHHVKKHPHLQGKL